MNKLVRDEIKKLTKYYNILSKEKRKRRGHKVKEKYL